MEIFPKLAEPIHSATAIVHDVDEEDDDSLENDCIDILSDMAQHWMLIISNYDHGRWQDRLPLSSVLLEKIKKQALQSRADWKAIYDEICDAWR